LDPFIICSPGSGSVYYIRIRIKLDPYIIGSPGSGSRSIDSQSAGSGYYIEYTDPQHCLGATTGISRKTAIMDFYGILVETAQIGSNLKVLSKEKKGGCCLVSIDRY